MRILDCVCPLSEVAYYMNLTYPPQSAMHHISRVKVVQTTGNIYELEVEMVVISGSEGSVMIIGPHQRSAVELRITLEKV
jgi:hypothetical protein